MGYHPRAAVINLGCSPLDLALYQYAGRAPSPKENEPFGGVVFFASLTIPLVLLLRGSLGLSAPNIKTPGLMSGFKFTFNALVGAPGTVPKCLPSNASAGACSKLNSTAN